MARRRGLIAALSAGCLALALADAVSHAQVPQEARAPDVAAAAADAARPTSY